MKEPTMKRIPMNVQYVVKPSGLPEMLKYMKELTLERNPMNVKYVVQH